MASSKGREPISSHTYPALLDRLLTWATHGRRRRGPSAWGRNTSPIFWELDEPTVLKAAGLKAERLISLAEALIAASSPRHSAILTHKDPEFDTLPDSIKRERLSYRAAGKAR